ncbi:branched-chain amino acid aminotransferase [Lacibacter sp.]|uniref:branched-chain amino acid aminotransferase n=1 Tax=Lacibacter sp. TaxID=1915409 RepID=UPI002B4B2B0B|nr:branched-chain amino acid aminotransferase [Lacibacter sp.]HLP36697.1 branched-chain amino acid aminotransferase [Lacibacter sp.]
MIGAMEILITKSETSKLSSLDLGNVPFGKHFTDHMLVADYEDGEWKNVEIKPYQPITISPANAAMHYGQSIFEGIKAFRHENGEAYIFRPYDNYNRFNKSAERMQMPAVPEEIFIEGMRKLIEVDKDWIPMKKDHSLYIRPFMFANDDVIGVKPSDKYKFMIILCPTGPYYAVPMKIYVEEQFVRAVPGGVGFAKAAGNYGSSMYPTNEAKKKGYDQVLWTDAVEHKYLQEFGMMNGFVIIGNTAITPNLDEGTILAGVTRDSVIAILKDMGLTVEERPISIHEVVDAYNSGTLKEVFGTGTAATISMIKELCYKDNVMKFDTDKWTISPEVKRRLTDIREGKAADIHEWLFKI